MGEDDYSWLMDDGALGDGGLDPSLLPLMPQPIDQLYTPMEPFNPASPEYGNYAIDWEGTPMPQLNVGGGSKGNSSGNSSVLGQVLRLFGLDGSNGGNIMPLLSLLGIGAGAYLNHQASQEGADKMNASIDAANTKVTDILGGANNLFAPYAAMGNAAAARLQAMPDSNLSAMFRPLGTGRGIVSAPNMTLGKLAGG